jgi:hypothetical protein
MAVGRERCNLNKSYTVSCIENNKQGHLCECVIGAVLTEYSTLLFYILNTKSSQWNNTITYKY